MAVVLSSEENNYFSASPLRRSHSQPGFPTKQTSFHASNSASRIHDIFPDTVKVYGDSSPSSAPSSPQTIQAPTPDDLSYSSTPATNVSLADDGDDDTLALGEFQTDNHLKLPAYDYALGDEDLEPPPSPGTPYDGNGTATPTSRPESPEVSLQHPVDDTAVGAQPSRHVDYLSHDWREEDIWSSWKYIVSKKGDYSNAARLENASWRTWMKAKNKLKTVSPETLNWLKDCDVTWLYGPLQTGSNLIPPQTAPGSSGLSKSNSFLVAHKKPILKKRTMSEVMLQRSLSASSLVKQAAAAVQAQQHENNKRLARPRLERSTTDYDTFPFSSRRMSRENTSRLTSAVSSGIISPSGERKHIHFNEQVEQCIAIDVKGNDEDEEVENDRFTFDDDDDSDSSDDGAIMMKKTVTKKRRPILKRAHSDNSKGESKTIAMLPSTTLKYREDTPEPQETAMKHSNALYRSPILSPSSSQETLRPSKASGKFFFNDDDDEEEDDEEEDNRFSGLRSPTKFGSSSGLHRSTSSGSLTAEPAGMRRTESGMFMPYEEGESASANEGIFGRVIDTKKKAKAPHGPSLFSSAKR